MLGNSTSEVCQLRLVFLLYVAAAWRTYADCFYCSSTLNRSLWINLTLNKMQCWHCILVPQRGFGTDTAEVCVSTKRLGKEFRHLYGNGIRLFSIYEWVALQFVRHELSECA